MTYLLLALALIALTFLIDTFLLKTFVVRNKNTWLTLFALLILTLFFDNILVGLPIVTYTHSTLSGLRIGHIPLEDFSYTFVAVIVPLSVQKYFV